MIEVKQLCKWYGRKQVIKDVSFTAKKGEITCLLGVNGTGKTTLMNAIMRLTPVQKGTVTVDGAVLGNHISTKVAYVPDRGISLLPHTVKQTLLFMEDFYPQWNVEKARELVSFFHLTVDDHIRTLSKGTLAKLNILCGLAQDTDYLIMDEPFSGIDAFAREQILNVFTSKLIEQKGVLLATHDISEVEQMMDSVILFDNGAVALQFCPAEYRQQYNKSVLDVMKEVYAS